MDKDNENIRRPRGPYKRYVTNPLLKVPYSTLSSQRKNASAKKSQRRQKEVSKQIIYASHI